jgi:hypothetical protein
MAGASDNGGWSSDGGSPDDLPDLPEEWGVIVIPDDLSELSDEVEAIRAELRESERATRWQRLRNRPAMRRLRRVAAVTLRAPVLIISMAVLVTVASLFASAWPGPPRQPATQRTASTTDDSGGKLPALELLGTDGHTVSLGAKLPAVILLTDDCDCAKLVADTTAAVRPEIAVIVIEAAPKPTSAIGATSSAVTPPTGATPQAEGKTVRVLHPASGNVRSELKVGPPDETAAAFLVNQTGEVILKLTRTVSLDDFRDQLARL